MPVKPLPVKPLPVKPLPVKPLPVKPLPIIGTLPLPAVIIPAAAVIVAVLVSLAVFGGLFSGSNRNSSGASVREPRSGSSDRSPDRGDRGDTPRNPLRGREDLGYDPDHVLHDDPGGNRPPSDRFNDPSTPLAAFAPATYEEFLTFVRTNGDELREGSKTNIAGFFSGSDPGRDMPQSSRELFGADARWYQFTGSTTVRNHYYLSREVFVDFYAQLESYQWAEIVADYIADNNGFSGDTMTANMGFWTLNRAIRSSEFAHPRGPVHTLSNGGSAYVNMFSTSSRDFDPEEDVLVFDPANGYVVVMLRNSTVPEPGAQPREIVAFLSFSYDINGRVQADGYMMQTEYQSGLRTLKSITLDQNW